MRLRTAILSGPVLIAADQALKAWSDSNLRILSRHEIFGQNWLVLSRVLNRGLAMDRYSGVPNGFIEVYTRYWPSFFWGSLALLAASRWRQAERVERLGFWLLLWGGASNLWNHWRSEFVTDPLQVYLGGGEYLPFNIADLGIVAGAGLLVALLVREFFASPSAEEPRFRISAPGPGSV